MALVPLCQSDEDEPEAESDFDETNFAVSDGSNRSSRSKKKPKSTKKKKKGGHGSREERFIRIIFKHQVGPACTLVSGADARSPVWVQRYLNPDWPEYVFHRPLVSNPPPLASPMPSGDGGRRRL